mgnify:CR=1 FL=1
MGSRRQPHDLGPDDLVWDFFSRPRDEPMLARVRPAAEAGFAGLGMYLGAWIAMRDDAMRDAALIHHPKAATFTFWRRGCRPKHYFSTIVDSNTSMFQKTFVWVGARTQRRLWND